MNLAPARPVRFPQMIPEEQPQRTNRLIERTALVALGLLKEMEECQDLILGQQRRAGHARVFRNPPDPTEIGLLSPRADRFQLNKADECE